MPVLGTGIHEFAKERYDETWITGSRHFVSAR